MFGYRPGTVLARVRAPIVAVRRITPGDDAALAPGSDGPSLPGLAGSAVVDVPAPGHNLLRYRPDEVTAAILGR